MAQITWRNINDPSFRGGNLARIAGTESLNRGINTLANLAGDINQEQVQEGTSAYLDQISNLDREGVAAAQASGQFDRDRLGNVDKDAVIAALKGRTAEIDKKEDTAFNRSEMLRQRAEAPVIEQINTLVAQGKFKEADVLANESKIQNKSALFKNIKGSKRLFEEQQRSDTDRIQAEDRNTILQTSLADRQNTIANNQSIVSQIEQLGVPVDADLNIDFNSPAAVQNFGQLKQLADQLQPVESETQYIKGLENKLRATGSDVTEVSGSLGVGQQEYSRANKLSVGDQQDLSNAIELKRQEFTTKFNQQQKIHDELSKVTPTDKPLTQSQKVEAESSVLQFAKELAPSSSWIPDGTKTGGTYLQDELTTLMQEPGVEPWMVKAALIAQTQTAEEAWGNPTSDIKGIKDQVKLYKADPSGESLKIKLAKSREKLNEAELELPLKISREISKLTKQAKINAGVPYRNYGGRTQK